LGQSPKLRKPKRYAFWFGILPPPFGRNPESLPGLGLGKLSLFSAKSATEVPGTKQGAMERSPA
jgi:hypothetical protein